MDPCPNTSSYVASSLVDAFHGIPHVDINLNQTSSDFSLSIEYFHAVVIWACVPILAILCIFILMSVYFICVCCCCCCQQHEPRSKCSRATCGVLVVVLIVIGLACCGVALWAEFSLDSQINSAGDAALRVNSVVGDVQLQAQTFDFEETSSQVAKLSMDVNNSDSGLSGYDMAVAAVGDITSELPDLEEAFMQINTTIGDVDLSSAVDTVDFVELVRHWVVVAYIIITIVFLVIVALSVLCGAMCGSPVCMVIALLLFSVFTVTMWVAVGGNLAYLIISGDICSDPDDIFRMNVPLSTDQLDYFLICEDRCYPNPFNVADARSALIAIGEEQDTLSMFANDNNLQDVQESLAEVFETFDSVSSAVANLTMLTNCTTVNEEYLNVLDGLCSDGYMFAVILFGMACGLSIIFILLICFGSFYAGLLSKGRTFDDETIVYDFPNDDGPSPWQSYGTQQRYHNTQEQYYNNGEESFNMASTQQQPEPPKYTDLHQESHMNGGNIG